MSQPQSVEAARARIQRLVEEIATLSKSEVSSEEYYRQYLEKVVAACDGRGGAVWLVGKQSADGKSEFQLAAAQDLEATLFQTDEEQRALLLRALAEAVNTKKPTVISTDAAGAAEDGSLQSQLGQMSGGGGKSPNKTQFPFIHVPLFLKEQVLGVLQVWLQPYVTKANYQEFGTFLTQLAAHVEQHFQSRRMGGMVIENQRLQHLLKLVSDLAGSLDPQEIARLTANYGRDLLACERCAVLRLRGGKWEALAISGQEVVEKKSGMVKGLVAFVNAHTPLDPLIVQHESGTSEEKPWVIALGKTELLALCENSADVAESRAVILRPHGSTEVADLAFFEDNQVVSTLIVQLLDADKRVIGAILGESTTEGFFDVPAGAKDAPSHRLAEWIANNAGRAMQAALDHTDLPFLFATKRLRQVKRGVTGSHRGRYLFKRGFWLAVIFGILFFPWMEEVESDCTLVPKQRVKVVAEVPGRVDEVIAREGSILKKGDPIAQLDTAALDADLAHTMQEMEAALAEVRHYRGLSDSSSELIAQTKVRSAEERMKRTRRDIEAATLRAPIDGVLLTKDIELMRGVYLTAGADFCVVGTTDAWDVQVHLHEKEIGKVEKLFASEGSVEVRYILYTTNQHELFGKFDKQSQLSEIAYPHQRENAVKENAFVLTLSDVQKTVPAEVSARFRPDLTGRASVHLGRRPVVFIWGRGIAQWFRLKWVW